MSPISRGFHGRRPPRRRPGRVPPGQYVVTRLPGAVGRPDAAHAARGVVASRSTARSTRPRRGRGRSSSPSRRRRSRSTSTASRSGRSSTRRGPACRSTRCSRTSSTEAEYVTAYCDGDYTTNLPLEDVTDGKAWVVHTFDGEPLEPEHGGPARLLVPHLYFWKSAKWVRGLVLTPEDEPGFWEAARLPQPRRPVEGAAVLGRLRAPLRLAPRHRRDVRRRDRRARARSCSTSPAGPATSPASTSTCA